MKRFIAYAFGLTISAAGAASAWAGEASTWASADNRSSAATANYDGNGGRGYARTKTKSGRVNLAKGVAVGFDRDGIDLSVSGAVAGRFGPAVAGTFNMSIGRDGSVSKSFGGSVARGGHARSAEASGLTRSRWHGTSSRATAGGRTFGGGRVKARTHSRNWRPHPRW